MIVRKAFLAVVFVLVLGLVATAVALSQAGNSNSVGTYQVATSYRDVGDWVFVTVIDTRSGEIVQKTSYHGM